MATFGDQFPAKRPQKPTLRRVKTKESRSKRGDVHGPSTVYVQVVGAGSRDSPASLYVFSEFNRSDRGRNSSKSDRSSLAQSSPKRDELHHNGRVDESALKDGKTIVHDGKEVLLESLALIRLQVQTSSAPSQFASVSQIRPEQVCTPTDPGPVFIVVECPSEEFIEGVCTNQQLRRFPSTTEHLVLNEQVCTVHNIRSHKIQTQLNMIHPEIFPELKAYKAKQPQAALHVPNVRAECLLKFQLRPVMEWQRDAVSSCSSEEFVKEASEVTNFLEEVEKCRRTCSAEERELSGRPFSPIYLVAPAQIMAWLGQYHDYCEEILSHFNHIPNRFLCDDAEVSKPKTHSFIQAMMKKNDLEE
ncbi:hypothetical protein XENOCAPTIV_004192, partial [Xenoophorus captivus]